MKVPLGSAKGALLSLVSEFVLVLLDVGDGPVEFCASSLDEPDELVDFLDLSFGELLGMTPDTAFSLCRK